MKKIMNLLSLHLFLFIAMIVYVLFIAENKFFIFILTLSYIMITLAVLIFSLIFKNIHTAAGVVLFWIIFILFAARINFINRSYEEFNGMIEGNTAVIGEVISFPEINNGKTEMIIKTLGVRKEGINDYVKSCGARVLVKIKDPDNRSGIKKGDIIQINKKYKIPREKVFNFKYRVFLFNKNIYADIYPEQKDVSILHISAGTLRFNKVLYGLWLFRAGLFKKLRTILSESAYFFVISVFFGERSGLDDEISRQFTNTGMMHLIAVSGLNIGFISMIIYGIFKIFFSRSVSLSLSAVAVSLYVLMIKPSPSCYRAYFMFIIIAVFFISGINTSGFTALLMSGIMLLFINPFYAFDLGFRFSFFASAGIILFNKEINEMLPLKIHEKMRALISVTLSAFLSVFMIQWSVFKKVPFFSLISSVFLVPAYEIMFGFLFFLIIIVYLSGWIFIAKIIEITSGAFLKIIELLDKIPSADMPDMPEYACFVFFIFLILFFYILRPLLGKWIRHVFYHKIFY